MAALKLQLPENLQRALEARASLHARSIEEEAHSLLERALGGLTATDEEQLQQLAFLDDEQLWRVAQQKLSAEKNERMQWFSEQQSAAGLTPEEQQEAQTLQRDAQRIMLLKAEAAALLKRRGHDIHRLSEPH